MMFNVKVYAEFGTAPSAQKADREFLAELRNVRNQTGARFVNFAVLDYRKENPDTVHFLTYPMDWIARYIRNFYMSVDPLLAIDYRRASVVDWMDLHRDRGAAALFEEFVGAGIGNNGVSVATSAGGANYCVLSLVYQCADGDWPVLCRNNIDLFRFLSDRLGERYFELFENREVPAKSLTPRERQVLQFVAFGHTDEQIANLMGIGKWTVVSHIQSAKYKLGCTNRTAAVAYALSTGQIEYHRVVGDK
jgi:DNA-binding CsgD family transcriptional regulator